MTRRKFSILAEQLRLMLQGYPFPQETISPTVNMDHLDLLGKGMALTCALFWAVAVILFKRSGETIPPDLLNLFKSIITSFLFLPVLLLVPVTSSGAPISQYELFLIVASGVVGIVIADTLFFSALNKLGAGTTAIVDCAYSPFVIGFSCLILGTSLKMPEIIGSMLVICAVLVSGTDFTDFKGEKQKLFMGLLLGVSSMACMAMSIIIMKPLLHTVSIWWIAGLRFMASAVILAGLVLVQHKWSRFISLFRTKKSWRLVFPASVLGNFIAVTMWVAAFKYTDMHSAAILNQTSTIFIVILASLILKESFTRRKFCATVMAFLGVVVVSI